jgi:hypothetical protein
LIKEDWIQIPVKPVIRVIKQSSYSTYNYGSNQTKFENKNAIPRLLWFHKDSSLFDVFEEIVKQFSFAYQQDIVTHDQ